MPETIKGINIVMGAETTGLSKALNDVNKKSRDIQGELRAVEKLLKLDPSNVQIIAQKQQLLADAVDNAREKLDRLKSVQQQVADQFARGEISQGQFRAFEREVAAAEQQLKKFDDQIPKLEKNVKSLGDSFDGVGEKLNGIGGKLSAGVTAPVVAGIGLLTECTKEFSLELAKLETNAKQAGVNMDVMHESMRNLEAVTGETDSNVEGLSNLLAAGFEGDNLTPAMEALAGAAIKFKDTLKFEGLADGLQETLATGAAIGPFAELLDRSGVSLDTFNAGLKEAIANGTQEQYVLDTLAKMGLPQVYEQFMKGNEGLTESSKATYDLNKALSDLAGVVRPIVTEVVKALTDLVEWFGKLDEDTQKTILTVGGLAAAAGPLAVAIGALCTPVGAVVAAIAALVAIGTTLYYHWDEIKAKMAEIWEAIKQTAQDTWNRIKDFFIKFGEDVKATLTNTWTNIKTTAATAWNELVAITVNAFSSAISKIVEVGKNIVKGLWEGIKSMAGWIYDMVSDFVSGIVDAAEDMLGIHSPSRVFADIGKNVSLGLAEGIAGAEDAVQRAMAGLTSNMQIQASLGMAGALGGGSNHSSTVIQKIEINGVSDPEEVINVLNRELKRRGVRL